MVAVVGGFFRFWHLDRRTSLVFDETYYVKQGYSYLKMATSCVSGPASRRDPKFTKGTSTSSSSTPDFVVHPPVGKWMIAFGEWLFGPTSSWGWRFSAALVGTLAILMIGRIGRRLFGSTCWAPWPPCCWRSTVRTLVHSRTGILDVFVMFWALAGFGCLVIDRDHARDRLGRPHGGADGAALADGLGPGLGVRWWRLAGAVCLGLCAGVKWSGLFFLAAFC